MAAPHAPRCVGKAHVPAHHLDEQRVALGGPYRRHVADRPQHEPGDPEPKPEADRGRQRAVEDGDGARRAGEQDRLGERPMHRRLEPGDQVLAR